MATEHKVIKRRNEVLHKRFKKLVKKKRGAIFGITVTIVCLLCMFFILIHFLISIPITDGSFFSAVSLFLTCIIFSSNMEIQNVESFEEIKKEMYEICLELEENNCINDTEKEFLDKFLK